MVSSFRLLDSTLNILLRRFDAELLTIGICALLQREINDSKKILDIIPNRLNSSEFILKIVKFVLFIALKLSQPVNSVKKEQI
jgi:hypothetical protein